MCQTKRYVERKLCCIGPQKVDDATIYAPVLYNTGSMRLIAELATAVNVALAARLQARARGGAAVDCECDVMELPGR